MAPGLRKTVMVGGAFLALRQSIGMGISLLTVLFLTRAAGPAAYGVFTAAMAVFGFVQALVHAALVGTERAAALQHQCDDRILRDQLR